MNAILLAILLSTRPDSFGVMVDPTWYDPALGGVNCMGDCTRTASGELVADWYGRGAACPEEYPYGTRFAFDGMVWTCVDRGEAIVMQGNVARIDLLAKEPVVERQLRYARVYPPGAEIPANPPALLAQRDMPEFVCPVADCGAIVKPVSAEHLAVDLAAVKVSAPAGGVVTFAGDAGGCGGSVELDYGNGWHGRICHLTRLFVHVGEYVEAGQFIGFAGDSGQTEDGAHVHIETDSRYGIRDFTRYLWPEPVVMVGGFVQ